MKKKTIALAIAGCIAASLYAPAPVSADGGANGEVNVDNVLENDPMLQSSWKKDPADGGSAEKLPPYNDEASADAGEDGTVPIVRGGEPVGSASAADAVSDAARAAENEAREARAAAAKAEAERDAMAAEAARDEQRDAAAEKERVAREQALMKRLDAAEAAARAAEARAKEAEEASSAAAARAAKAEERAALAKDRLAKATEAKATADAKEAMEQAKIDAKERAKAKKEAKEAEKKAKKEAEKKAKEKRDRFKPIFSDDSYNYFLDTKSVRWISMPQSGVEQIIDVWIRLEPKTTEGADAKDAKDTKTAGEDYSYPAKYYLEHYYIRPEKRQIQFLSELEVTGRPQNTIEEKPFSSDRWEELVPESIEDNVYRAVTAYMKKRNHTGGLIPDHMSVRDAIEEYLRISL